MRSTLVRFAVLAAAIAVVVSCDTGPVTGTFGNGISGGATGTGPVTPPNPGTPDTGGLFVRIDTPTTAQLVNVGDSILVVVRFVDDRQLGTLTIQGLKLSGDPALGTFQQTIRYAPVTVPVPGTAFRAGLQDTIIRRYLQPAAPLDTTVDSLIVMAIASDAAGNVDTAQVRVNIVTGPKLAITLPVGGDSVPQNLAMAVTVRGTHPDGIASMTIRVFGETTWPTPLDATIVTLFVPPALDTNLTVAVPIPGDAPLRGRVTITASAVDINRNPGNASPVLVFVRAQGTLPPRVFQDVPDKMEFSDSVTVTAQGDGIEFVGLLLFDSTGAAIPSAPPVQFVAPFVSNKVVRLPLNLGTVHQGQRIRIQSFATDFLGRTGFSIQQGTTTPQANPANAFTDTTLVTFGRTFPFPRNGVAGDIAVDELRGNVIVSNTQFNLLEVWRNGSKDFQPDGVAVGALPWGLFISSNPNELLVGNSGATTISRVCLAACAGGAIQEDLTRRIRTRNNTVFRVQYFLDEVTNLSTLVQLPPISYSDRPQYVAQSAGGRVYFSTRPTAAAPEGTLRWLDPTQQFPEMRQVVSYADGIPGDNVTYAIFDADSILIIKAPPNANQSDRLIVWDHDNGTLGDPLVPGQINTGDEPVPDDAADEARAQGGDTFAVLALDVSSLALTDTTFVAASGDRNWIGFGEGNTQGTGRIMFVRDPVGPGPTLFSPATDVIDIVHNASERVFGLALDRTGLQATAHGLQTYVAALDVPFHLRLDGVYDSFDNGAGVAYHPLANSTLSANANRVLFTATQSGVIEIVDVAHYNNRGRLVTKGNFYGPLRATNPLPGDPPEVILKLYGLSDGGLVVIDLRAADIRPGP